MFRRILVPLDGSQFAESAISAAIALCQRTEGAVRLVHVLDPVIAHVLPERSASDRARMEAYLGEMEGRVRQISALPVTSTIRQGRIADELEAEAQEWGADVLVMSTHGRSGISRLWMGSVADRYMRSASCPVLLVRPQEGERLDPSRYRAARIVVPLDGSPEAEVALPHAIALARAFAAQILVLRVVTQPGGFEMLNSPEAMDALSRARAQDRVEADEYVNQRVAALQAMGLDGLGVVWTEPGPAEAIAARSEGDWLVMSTHGRSAVERVFLGSVTDKVLRSSAQPVLVVPPPGTSRSSQDGAIPEPTSAARGES